MRTSRLLAVALAALLLTTVIGAVLFFTLNTRNAARPEALAALASDQVVKVARASEQDWYIFTPTKQTPTTGFILYPGGFVDPVAYAPIARELAAQGYLIVLNPMPLNLAVFGIESANDIIAAFPKITAWGIGGHSLGGAMAAEYVKGNADVIDGLALWAAYPAENSDLSDLSLEVVSIYGDADGVASVADVEGGAQRLPASAVFVPIPGGNHTQFGRYGEGLQRGDNPAGISADTQQRIIVETTGHMLESIAAGG